MADLDLKQHIKALNELVLEDDEKADLMKFLGEAVGDEKK